MRYRITWEGSESDLEELIKEHVETNNNWECFDGTFNAKIIREKLIGLHLTLGGRLKNVTIKIEDLKDGDA